MMSLSLSQESKQSGFTLIELMVVMAIIAILATAGLSAYTGYLKKARDAVRIADINAINTIVMGMMSANGTPPQTAKEVYDAVTAANNGIVLMDPLSSNNGVTTKYVCLGGTSGRSATCPGKLSCSYTYRICDGGSGYAVGTRFESVSNSPVYLTDNIPTATHSWWDTDSIFEMGSCKISDPHPGSWTATPVLPTTISSNNTSTQNWYIQICGSE